MHFNTSITDILKLHRGILTDLQKRLGSSQGSITLTTSGTSGASTLIGNSLNIPLYSSNATASWGSITGTLASQTDLNTALLAKVTGNSSITGATKTKITYDSKGLVTSGVDATTADIADSLNKRYVTDAQQTIIGSTSGTNTGDNATNSQYSGLAASKQDTLVSGTNIKTINSTTLLGSGNITTGSVTNVSALTLGTSGTDLSSTVATGTTTPIITLNVPTASALNRGVLDTSDWTTFNNKQVALISGTNIKTVNSISLLGSGNVGVGVTSVTGTLPISSSGGSTPVISITQSSNISNGYLSSGDWITFNSKENVLTFSSPLSRSTNTVSISAATVSVNGYLTSTDWATFNSKQGLLSITSLTNTGTDGITIVNGTGSVIGPSPVTIDQQVANASQNGYLSKTDWAAFNGKGYGTVTNVTGTSPIASSGGATPNITILQSSGTVNGYLSSTDWTTFNNKGSGTVTSVGGTGTVSGLSLSGSVTTTGNLTLGGTLSLTSGDVTTALGFTPYNATNPSGYTNNTGTVTSVSGTGTISGLTLTGTVTNSGSLTLGGTLSLTSLNVTTALGYTPYNATNPSGYTNNVGTVTSVATGTGLTGGTITGSGTISFSTAAVGTWAATPSSANLASAMTDETGTGKLVFGTSPTITTSLTVNGQTISGYNTTPLQGSIQDGVTSILGDLKAWTTDYYQGTVLYSETSSTTITFGQLCYRTNLGEWGLADATSFAAAAYYMLGICLKTTTGSSQPTSILINGFVESTYVADFKVGEPQYMTTTAGSMSKSAPASSGNIVRIIGNTFWTTALQTNAKCVLHFNPDKTWIELT